MVHSSISPKTDEQTEVVPSEEVPENLEDPAAVVAPRTPTMYFGVTLTILLGGIVHLHVDANPHFGVLVGTVMMLLRSTTIVDLVVFDATNAFNTYVLNTARGWLNRWGLHGSNGSTSIEKLSVCRGYVHLVIDYVEGVADAFPNLDKLQINNGTLDGQECRALLWLFPNLRVVVPPRQRHVAAHVRVGPRTNFAGQQLHPAVELVGVEGFYSDELHSDDGG